MKNELKRIKTFPNGNIFQIDSLNYLKIELKIDFIEEIFFWESLKRMKEYLMKTKYKFNINNIGVTQDCQYIIICLYNLDVKKIESIYYKYWELLIDTKISDTNFRKEELISNSQQKVLKRLED